MKKSIDLQTFTKYIRTHWNLRARWKAGQNWRKMIAFYEIPYEAPRWDFRFGKRILFAIKVPDFLYNFYLGWDYYPDYVTHHKAHDISLTIYDKNKNALVVSNATKAPKSMYDNWMVTITELTRISDEASNTQKKVN